MQTAVHLEYLCFGAIAFESASKYIHLFSESQLYKMSIPFVFVFVRFFLSVCINTICTPTILPLLYTHYPLGNSSHTYPYVNCEHVLKHILLKYTQSERSIWYGGSILMPRAYEAIGYGICSPIPTFYTINLMALTA